MIDWNYKNFSEDELKCRCGCGRADMAAGFMSQLQSLRDAYKAPLIVTSGYRCERHNKAVRGGPVHPMGRAVDIGIMGHDAYALTKLAMLWGFTGIGWKQHSDARFIHLDNLSTQEAHEIGLNRPWVWSYK